MEELLLSEMRRLNDPFRLWNQPQNEAKLISINKPPKKKRKKPKKTAD
jgi:choline-sulfatase